ncbi:MAG: exodeoxyribonuclease VII large subunit, partial [Candidatus Polarisedimenticolia bacterium]
AEAALARSARGRLRALRGSLEARASLLASLSPLSVLDRGYALVQDPSTGRVISDAGTLSAGGDVRVRLARGRFDARVERVEREPEEDHDGETT